MKFKYVDNSYIGNLSYKFGEFEYSINAIFDTGCTISSIGLYSLSSLIRKPCEYIMSRIEQRYYTCPTQDASGGFHNNVRITIPNVILSNASASIQSEYDDNSKIKFDRFYCNLNIDDKLATTKGVYTVNGKSFKSPPYILIGCDFIRTFDNINLSQRNASLGRFDKDKYFNEVECKRGDSLFIFEDNAPHYKKEGFNTEDEYIDSLY